MFEKIILGRSEQGASLTLGEIAEALLFYQNVHIVLDHSTLFGLVKKIGMEKLLSLLSRPNVSAVYCEETLATRTDQLGPFTTHAFVTMIVSGDQQVGQLTSRGRRVEHILERNGYDRKRARRLVERFRDQVPFRKLTDNYFLPGGIVLAASNALCDRDFVHEAVRQAMVEGLGALAPMGNFRFEVSASRPAFQVLSDIDFIGINEAGSKRRPVVQITAAGILNEILMACADTAFAAHYGGEFYTSALSSRIVRIRHEVLLQRAGIDANELKMFQDVALPESPTIREAINSGARSFDEFLLVLEKSQRFREWIQKVNPDENLLHAFMRDVTAVGWIGKLPTKSLRYVIGSIVGVLNPLAGLGLSAVDSLLLEKFFGGWRPSHFIDTRLRPFLSPSEVDD